MIADGELAIQEVPLLSGRVQKRTVNLRPPNLSVFSAAEIALVDEVIEALKETRADIVSELSHRMVGWKVAKLGEDIPYGSVFLSNEPLCDAETQRGLDLAAEHGVLE